MTVMLDLDTLKIMLGIWKLSPLDVTSTINKEKIQSGTSSVLWNPIKDISDIMNLDKLYIILGLCNLEIESFRWYVRDKKL